MFILFKAIQLLEGEWQFVSWPNRWEIECTSQLWWSVPKMSPSNKLLSSLHTTTIKAWWWCWAIFFGGLLNWIKSELVSTFIDKWKRCLFLRFLHELLHTKRSSTPEIDGLIGKSWNVVFIFGQYCSLDISQISTPKQEDCIPPLTVFLVYGQMHPPKGTGPLIKS